MLYINMEKSLKNVEWKTQGAIVYVQYDSSLYKAESCQEKAIYCLEIHTEGEV